jgi:hypothetical protein
MARECRSHFTAASLNPTFRRQCQLAALGNQCGRRSALPALRQFHSHGLARCRSSATAPLRFAPASQSHRSAAVAPLPCCASPARVNATLRALSLRSATFRLAALARYEPRFRSPRSGLRCSLRCAPRLRARSARSARQFTNARSARSFSVAGRQTRRFAPRCKLALTRSRMSCVRTAHCGRRPHCARSIDE